MESNVVPLHLNQHQARALSRDAASWRADPVARLAELKAERERLRARLDEVGAEERRIRAAMKRPDKTCLPYSAVEPPARRSALYIELDRHGRNQHAAFVKAGAPIAAQGWALAHVHFWEAEVVAAVLRRAARMKGGHRLLRAAAMKAEHQLLMQWFIEGPEGERARAAGVPPRDLRRRARAHARRHGTRSGAPGAKLAPLASALYKAATAHKARAGDAPELDAP